MRKQKRKLYRTKFHNLEELDPRSVEWCMQCGSCLNDHRTLVGIQGACPIFKHGKPFESYMPRGRQQTIRALLEGRLEPSQALSDAAFMCTTCNACNSVCHSTHTDTQSWPISRVNDQAYVFENLRADLMGMGFAHLDGHRVLLGALANYDNPWGQPRRAKADWARKSKLAGKDLGKKMEKVDVLLFHGCTAPLDRSLQDVTLATGQFLDKAGVNWGYLGGKEICCGSITARLGELGAFKEIVKRNVKLLNDLYDNYGVKTIVTSCAGCFKTLFQDYPEFIEYEGDIDMIKAEVIHSSIYAKQLVDQGKVTFNNGLNMKVTYHDPCHLGRHCHVYETPRELLQQIPGVEFVEMFRNRKYSLCCGSGGGMKGGYPDMAMSIGTERVHDAEGVGADYIITTCPFCEQNIRDAIKGCDSKVKLLDLVQLMALSSGARTGPMQAITDLPGPPKGVVYGGD
jgi:heterodisulfide reductase subunit D